MNNDQSIGSQYDPSLQSFRRDAMPDPSQPLPDDIDVQAEQLAQEENIQGQSHLTSNSSRQLRTFKLFFFGACFVCVVLVAGWMLLFSGGNDEEVVKEKTRVGTTTSNLQVNKLAYDKLRDPEPEVKPETKEEPEKEVKRLQRPVLEEQPPAPVMVTADQTLNNRTVLNEKPVPQGPSLADLQRAAPMMGNTGNAGGGLNAVTQQAGQGIPSGSSQGGFPDLGAAGEKFTQLMTGSKTEPTRVTRLKNRHLTIEKGTFIDCILETRLDTSVPGMTACIIPQHVYSMDGKSLLIEKGSRALGEYRGSVQNGLERIFILWTEVRTPNGMIVKLDSPATDALGGAGASGFVDHHWWKRFGNALLFSIISDAFDFATAKAQEGSNNNYYGNTSDNMAALIEEAMQQAGNIPPTLTKNQGERMGIFVGRDIDFSGVYELEAQE